MKDMFMYVYGPRLRDRTSHGEFNTYIGRDIKQEPWLEFYVVLILGLLQHSMTAKNDKCFGGHRAALDIINTYTSTRFDEWTVARRETMRCFSLLANYRNLVFLSETPWIDIAPLIKENSVFTLENLDSRSLPDQLSKAWMAWPIRPTTHLTAESGQAIGSMHNLPAWIIIIQRIQDCISNVTRKILSLSEQLQKRQLSSRSRKQFEAMKPVMPRLMCMLVSCLCLVEQRVLVCAKNESKGMSSCSTEDMRLLERAIQEDIQVRSRLTMFVDKFASNFERAKLNQMEVAWEDLAKGISGLEAA